MTPISLSSNGVTSLMFDSQGRLWVGTFETGLSLYDASRERFLNFPPHGARLFMVRGEMDPELSWKIVPGESGSLHCQATWCVSISGSGRIRNLDSLAGKIRFAAYALVLQPRTVGAYAEKRMV